MAKLLTHPDTRIHSFFKNQMKLMREVSAFRDVNKIEVTPLTSPFENIALAFSGGGFLAASYTLGVLSYLNRIKVGDSTSNTSETLLHHVKYISATSGGTITAASFAIYNSKGKTFEEFYGNLLNNLQGDTFLKEALRILQDSTAWKLRKEKSHNLINAFSLAFDRLFFQSTSVQDLLHDQEKQPYPLQELCFNTTEFYKGLVFRQQFFLSKSPPLKVPLCYGNYAVQVQSEAVSELLLSDMVAAASCQGGTFEPILFPIDFATNKLTAKEIKKQIVLVPQTGDKKEKEFIEHSCFGLMDGGLTDNQGLESLMEADLRRKTSHNDYDPFDFILVNDVDSHYMHPYVAPVIRKKEGTSFNGVLILSILIAIVSGILIYKWWNTSPGLLLLFGIILFVSLIPTAIVILINAAIRKALRSETGFVFSESFTNGIIKTALRFLASTNFPVLVQMFKARFNSVLSINMDVFIKRIRFLLYERFYHSGHWEDRGKGNHIYDLSFSNDINRTKEEQPPVLQPSRDMQTVAESAFRIGVTLWFDTESTKQKHALACSITSGQFTTCYNLLDYIFRLKDKYKEFEIFSPEYKDRLERIEAALIKDFEQFKQDPFFYYNELGKPMNLELVHASMIAMPESFANPDIAE